MFLDVNILFSAAKSEGAVRGLLTLLVRAGHECRDDGFVTVEARRKLSAKASQALPCWKYSARARMWRAPNPLVIAGRKDYKNVGYML